MDHPEREWLARYRAGDTEALGNLVQHYRRPLFGFILKMTERTGDAEEVFQEVWFRALKNLGSYQQKNFLGWLFRIAHNLVIDRARKARPVVDLAADQEGDEDPYETRVAAGKLTATDHVAGRDLGVRIAAAVQGLPLEQREVFVMRTEGEVPFKEIARIQGTSINTALARMHYALGKLREILQEDYQDLMRR
jgi:RNA polymerase sigma-70 factor (ECF subfamily)